MPRPGEVSQVELSAEGVLVMVQWVVNPTSIHEDAGSIPSLSQCCCEWCRSQVRLGSGVAVAGVWASSCSSNSPPSLGTSICCRCGPKEKKTLEFLLWYSELIRGLGWIPILAGG